MAKAYTPGLLVTSSTRHRSRRQLPIKGKVKVSVGTRVQADDVVAETALPGDVHPINLANIMSLPPADVPECMLKQEGDSVVVDEPLARSKGLFGLFKTIAHCRHEGTVETVSPVTGQVIVRGKPIPVDVRGYMAGEVVEVLEGEGCIIEADVAFIQGIFGIGGETHGTIRVVADSHEQSLGPEVITEEMAGCVIVGGARMTVEAIQRAKAIGAAALVSGGIDDHDLKNFLGYDLGVAITGRERVGLTVIITEGFGDIAMAHRTFQLLKAHEGREASVNGATQIRAGVMRPEIIIPLEAAMADSASDQEQGLLDIGRAIRIIRDPWFGMIGEVAGLPSEPQVLDSGSKARVLEVRFPDGETAIVPRANVELLEG